MIKSIKTSHMRSLSEPQQQLQNLRAKHENDLSVLLRPWYTFRIFLKFKKAFTNQKGEKRDANHFYGIENACTYNQCLHGHVDNIQLSRLGGFKNCVYMAEEKFRDDNKAPIYHFARIYMRTVYPNGVFDKLCREYNKKGELIECQDPVITEADNITLYFLINKLDCLELTKEPIPTTEEFKKLIGESLNA